MNAAGSMASGQTQSNPVYKLKRIDFFGRKVPIALQNENGPCPLLAIANILLLKKQIVLPEQAPDVSQSRLVSLVAGHLLDANDEQKVGKGLPEEYKANLRKNVADAFGILSKLTTGIDVNVRFHDVKGFEFTDEIAIFDLMDISLVHGWLVDPEDTAAAASLGQRSYNEVVEQLVMVLGDATPKRLITPQLSRRASGFSTPRRTSSGLGTIAASELLSPTEIGPTPKPTLAGPHLTEPSSSAESAPSSAAGASTSETDEPEPAVSSESHATPTGAMTSSDAHQPRVSEAAQAGGPTGSLVSAQRTATVTDSDPASATQSSVSHQSQNTQPQAQVAMISPAAEMASRAYPLPAAPLEGEGLTTPQNSTNYDAHIATAPTPYPSLASELGQANDSPVSSKGSVKSGALPPAGQGGPFDSPVSAANNSRSRFAPPDRQQLAESSGAATTSQAQPATSSATVPEASDAATPVRLKAEASTAEPDVKAAQATVSRHSEGRGPFDLDQSAEDISLSDLKLDTADDEQLQLALAISLGQQQAEEAQALAQDSSISESEMSGQLPEAASADPASSAEGKHAGHSHAANAGVLSKDGKPEAAPVTAAAAAAAAGSINVEPDTHEAGCADANQLANTPGGKAAAAGAGQAATTDAEQPQGSSAASAEPSAAQHDLLQEHQLSLLSPSATAQSSSSSAADGRQQQQQQPLVKPPSGTEAGTAGTRTRTTSEQEERSKAAAQAHLIQDFLDNSSSQLTYHGLASLRGGLRPNELAVFFRNNHFNTIFLHKGVVHILVTDQGYEFEKNVVWEKLDDLMGNTQFLKADFTPYGSNSLAEQVSDAADLVQAAFAGVGPNKSQTTDG
ncbi:MAG: NF-E2 inducible, partial [Trebouxia sp. A1-2]